MTLGKSSSFYVLLLPHLSRAAPCSPPLRGINRNASNCEPFPLQVPGNRAQPCICLTP